MSLENEEQTVLIEEGALQEPAPETRPGKLLVNPPRVGKKSWGVTLAVDDCQQGLSLLNLNNAKMTVNSKNKGVTPEKGATSIEPESLDLSEVKGLASHMQKRSMSQDDQVLEAPNFPSENQLAPEAISGHSSPFMVRVSVLRQKPWVRGLIWIFSVILGAVLAFYLH